MRQPKIMWKECGNLQGGFASDLIAAIEKAGLKEKRIFLPLSRGQTLHDGLLWMPSSYREGDWYQLSLRRGGFINAP